MIRNLMDKLPTVKASWRLLRASDSGNTVSMCISALCKDSSSTHSDSSSNAVQSAHSSSEQTPSKLLFLRQQCTVENVVIDEASFKVV